MPACRDDARIVSIVGRTECDVLAAAGALRDERKKNRLVLVQRQPAFFYPLTVCSKIGAAARMAEIERATALAVGDLGQRLLLVPLPESRLKVCEQLSPTDQS